MLRRSPPFLVSNVRQDEDRAKMIDDINAVLAELVDIVKWSGGQHPLNVLSAAPGGGHQQPRIAIARYPDGGLRRWGGEESAKRRRLP